VLVADPPLAGHEDVARSGESEDPVRGRGLALLSTLRSRLLALVIVAVVPAVAIFVASVRAQQRLLEEQAASAVTSLADLVAERNQRSVDVARGALLGITRMAAVSSLDGPRCSAHLASLLTEEPVFINLGAVRPDGTVFCSAAPAPRNVNLSDRPFIRDAIRFGGLGVGEYAISRIRGVGALGFGYPVRAHDGGIVAVAYASLSVDRLQTDLQGLDLPPGSEVAVLDRRGVTLSARPGSERWVGRTFDEPLVAKARAAGSPVALPGTDGVDRLYDLKVVTAPDGTVAMQILAGIPLGAVVDPVNRIATRALLGSLAASALALVLAVVMAEFLLVRRLHRLGEAARKIAAGDLSVRTGVASGDEIGQLAARLDDMSRALEALDREKRLREEQLRQAQKMEAVGQLAGGVAHDFNNLLTVVLSAGSSLRDRLREGDPGQEEAREIVAAAERAAALTRQLLAFSRRQHLAPRLVDLGEIASGMEAMLHRTLGEAVALRLERQGPAPVWADPGQVEIALLNLCVNARDAMPRGGRIDIGIATLAADDPARPAGPDVPAGPLALLSVRDTGSGIDAGTLARVFEPFFTTKGQGRGTGLGLPIVLAVVTEAGGAIRIESEQGRGTEFRLFFPLRPGEARAAAERLSPAHPTGTETVLVVEDDPHLRGVVRRVLSQHGYVVRAVSCAADARAVGGAAPDLIVADIILPDGNGLDLVRELSTRWPSAAVLFISGYTGEHLRAIGALPQDVHMLPKPFTVETLLVRVREALARRPAGSTTAA
jgi:signal transduction histidine kinase/ActR/RegA family two-component response regulator